MWRYIPNTGEQQQEMLEEIGVSALTSSFRYSPRVSGSTGTGSARTLSEMELIVHMRQLADKNVSADECACFLGAGAYDHYIPSVIQHLVRRQESIPPTRHTSRK